MAWWGFAVAVRLAHFFAMSSFDGGTNTIIIYDDSIPFLRDVE